MLFTLVVSVGLGLAVAKLRRQKEGRKVVAGLLGCGEIDFAEDYERQLNYGDPFLGFYVVEDLGWRYDLSTPNILKTIERFHGYYWRSRENGAGTDFEEAVSQMTNLHTLTLGNEMPLESLAPIAGLTKLETLRIGDLYGDHNFSLTERQLAVLKANPPRTLDLTPLSNLKQLKHLCLGNCGESDLTPLAGMTSLETLDLQFSYAADLKPFSQMVELRTLVLVLSLIHI